MDVQQDDDRLIPIKEACELLGGMNRATFYRGVKAGRFPAPVHPSPGISRVSRRKVIETRERIISGECV